MLGIRLIINRILCFATLFSIQEISSQNCYWQQSVDYKMEVELQYKKNKIVGKQQLVYTNNSPDTLTKVFYHLYYNAFQPGSSMDFKSRSSKDPDPRVGDRIAKLKNDEIGNQKIESLTMNGKKQKHHIEGTILEVSLTEPILPGKSATFALEFEGQIPLQIRRTGRFNKEGIEYSMSQWYPKMCNYDVQGWHTNPYIGREFYGIWGNFDVKITVPSSYIIGATGVLQNKQDVGYGYSEKEPKNRPEKLTYHFKAEKVHDFVWAADPDYKQIVHRAYDGTILRFFYQPGEKTSENWSKLPEILDNALRYINETYGKYPYSEYSFIQGGDGGMEYPMATLITGERPLISLVGVSVHEWMHTWYQMLMATNESLYPWMDEGFTSYASNEVMNYLKIKKLIPGEPEANPHVDEVRGYVNFANSGNEEALITHADRYISNTAYGVASYTKGEVFLEQIRYIIGEAAFNRGMLRYYAEWKYKHPTPNDFIRIMEKESDLELDWFKEYFVNTTQTIDYSIQELQGKLLIIERKGLIPMPLEITVTYMNGKVKNYYIPIDIMRGEKKEDRFFSDYTLLPDWEYSITSYKFELEKTIKDIKSIEIDASKRLADVDRDNNLFPRLQTVKGDKLSE